MTENKWIKLDNAAKIYPAFAHKYDPATFRVSVVMEHTIIPECLQRALDATLPHFPSMAVTLRRGLFWAYLDENPKQCIISEEKKMPCTYINLSRSNGYLFNVYYYDKRISLECFHALTDGYGAFEFLKALLYHYLNDFVDVSSDHLRLMGNTEENLRDGYKHFSNDTKHKLKNKRAKHITGTHIHTEGVLVNHALLSASTLKRTSKTFNTTITILLTALYIQSIFAIRKSGPISIAVPVNLRKIFKTDTLRNFVYVMNIVIEQNLSLNELISIIDKQFKEQIKPDNLQAKFSQNVSFEELFFMRVMPNILKSFLLKQARTFKMKSITTSVLTNPGIITLPESMMPYVKHFEMLLYASKPHNVNMGIVTYNNQLVISLSRCIEERDVIDYFFKLLKDITHDEIFIYSNEGD